MKIDLISQGRENVLFLPSNMAAMTSHALYVHGRRLKPTDETLIQLLSKGYQCPGKLCTLTREGLQGLLKEKQKVSRNAPG